MIVSFTFWLLFRLINFRAGVIVLGNNRTWNFFAEPEPNRNRTELLCIWFTLVPTQVDKNARWIS